MTINLYRPHPRFHAPPEKHIMKNRLRLSPAVFCAMIAISNAIAASPYIPPDSGRATYDFNPSWQFIKRDVPGANLATFDDKSWDTVSTPHTWNDIDSYDEYIYRGGERTLYMGPAWHRKHFKLPALSSSSKA